MAINPNLTRPQLLNINSFDSANGQIFKYLISSQTTLDNWVGATLRIKDNATDEVVYEEYKPIGLNRLYQFILEPDSGLENGVSYNAQYNSYTLTLKGEEGEIVINSGDMIVDTLTPSVGSNAVVYGNICNYSDGVKFNGNNDKNIAYPMILDISANYAEIAIENDIHSHVIKDKDNYLTGEQARLEVTVDEGYVIYKVLVDGEEININEGEYVFDVTKASHVVTVWTTCPNYKNVVDWNDIEAVNKWLNDNEAPDEIRFCVNKYLIENSK